MELWQKLNVASDDEASALLRRCCGASNWVTRMLRRRPFASQAELLDAAREEWFALSPTDWREAFSHHPKIGERSQFRETSDLSEREQAKVSEASAAVRRELVERNRQYEEKFGFIFIVCATGKSAEEMLALLHARLPNDPATEIRIAAEEQAKITALRLAAPK